MQSTLRFGALVTVLPSRGAFGDHILPIETGASPLIPADNAAIWAAQFSDACDFIAAAGDGTNAFPAPASDCAAFAGGLLLQGLATAAPVYIARSIAVAATRQRVRLFSGARSGLGILLAADSYNFSADADQSHAFEAANEDSLSTTLVDVQPPSVSPPISYAGELPEGAWEQTNGTSNYSIAEVLGGEDMRWVAEVDTRFLTPGFVGITARYYAAASRTLAETVAFITNFTLAFYLCYTLLVARSSLPAIAAQHAATVRKRHLLLLLPPPVLFNPASPFKRDVQAILADHELGRGTRSSSGRGKNV